MRRTRSRLEFLRRRLGWDGRYDGDGDLESLTDEELEDVIRQRGGPPPASPDGRYSDDELRAIAREDAP
jgi:hypothetical protein